MQMYQQVYMDTGAIWLSASFDREGIDTWLREMIANGLGSRVIFGTDQMRWPEAIGMSVDVIASSRALTEEQKRDIFYNNAARFLRLSSGEMARHHGKPQSGW